MNHHNTIHIQTRVAVAIAVVAALVATTSVAVHASRQATLSKLAAFEASTSYQLAARERNGRKLADATNPSSTGWARPIRDERHAN